MFDADGHEYLDLTGSAGVAQTGYGHPTVRAGASSTSSTDSTPRCSAATRTSPRSTLAERLCALAARRLRKEGVVRDHGLGRERLRRARLLPMATGRRRLISFVGGYHGTTTGSAALSGHQAQASVIGGGHVTKVPYPDPYRCAFGPVQQGGLLAALSRAPRALSRSARSRRRADTAADPHRGDPVGRWRGRAAGELHPGAARALRPARDLARLRRGEDRARPDRADVRASSTPDVVAGCRHARQAARRRAAALGGGRAGRAPRRADVQPLHARRLAAAVCRRPRDARRHPRRRASSTTRRAIGQAPARGPGGDPAAVDADRRRARQGSDPRSGAGGGSGHEGAGGASTRIAWRTGSSSSARSSSCQVLRAT